METLIASTIATLGISYYLKSGYLFASLTWFTVYLLFSTLVPFTRNIFVARRIGFPSIYIPWDPHSFLWMVLEHPITPYLQRWLPASLWARISLAGYGWEFRQRTVPFEKYAAPQGNRKSFMSVSFNAHPELYTWDAEIITQVLARPNDFQCDEFVKLFMDRFGPNLLTSNGDTWHRQRKVVAGVINEKISKAVFNETVQQAQGLLKEVFDENTGPDATSVDTNRMFDMMKKITIKVLSGAGLGKSAPWDDRRGEEARPGFKMNYMDSAKLVTESVAGPIILPQWFLDNYPISWPGADFLRQVGVAVREFPEHTRYALDQERQRNEMNKSGETRGNIMSQMLQALNTTTSAKGPAMHEDELTGNLFIFTVAGFDTTANTLSFALMLLARYPEWQDWLCEEIDELLPSGANSAELEYSDIHPKATRVLALMFEVLRLFPPVVHIVKQTRGEQIIQTSNGTYQLPDKTAVYMNSVGVHLDSDVYRNINIDGRRGEKASDNDELKFRPSRWLNDTSARTTHFQPPRGSYIPWSAGPRNCPGMKMAQVEFVAVIMMLLRNHRVAAVPMPGESRVQVEQRLDAQMRNSISKLTLEMVGVYDVVDAAQGFRLRLSKRETS